MGLRSVTISSSGMSVLAQWIAPAPMQNRARPSPRPRSLVDSPTREIMSFPDASAGLIAKKATMNNRVPNVESPNSVATSRSRRFAALVSMSE